MHRGGNRLLGVGDLGGLGGLGRSAQALHQGPATQGGEHLTDVAQLRADAVALSRGRGQLAVGLLTHPRRVVAGLGHDLVGLRLGVLEQLLGPRAHLLRVVLGPLGELAQPGLALGQGCLLLPAARLELCVGRLAAGGECDLELRRRRGGLEAVGLELRSELLALCGRDALGLGDDGLGLPVGLGDDAHGFLVRAGASLLGIRRRGRLELGGCTRGALADLVGLRTGAGAHLGCLLVGERQDLGDALTEVGERLTRRRSALLQVGHDPRLLAELASQVGQGSVELGQLHAALCSVLLGCLERAVLRLDEGVDLFGLVAAAGELEVWSVDHDRPMQGQGAGEGWTSPSWQASEQKAQRSRRPQGDWSVQADARVEDGVDDMSTTMLATTTAAEANSTMPMITGRSCWLIASIDGLAEAGQAEHGLGDDHAAEQCPRSMPNWVTTGVSAAAQPVPA